MTYENISVPEPFNMMSLYSDTASGHCIPYFVPKSFFFDLSAPVRTSPHLHFIPLQSKVIITHFAQSGATSPWNGVLPTKSRYIKFKKCSRAICRCQNRWNRIRFDHMVGRWKWYIPGPMKWVQLWPSVSQATEARRGQISANFTRLNELY